MEGWKQVCREICAAKGEPPCWKLDGHENCEPCEDCKVVGVLIDELRDGIDALQPNRPLTILDEAKAVLDRQTAKGIRKYGGPLDVTRPDAEAILDHAIEEAGDLLIYLVGLRAEIKRLRSGIDDLRRAIHACNRNPIPNSERRKWRGMCDALISEKRDGDDG